MPPSDLTPVDGPIQGSELMLRRIRAYSASMASLRNRMRRLNLFGTQDVPADDRMVDGTILPVGAGKSRRSALDHPVIQLLLFESERLDKAAARIAHIESQWDRDDIPQWRRHQYQLMWKEASTASNNIVVRMEEIVLRIMAELTKAARLEAGVVLEDIRRVRDLQLEAQRDGTRMKSAQEIMAEIKPEGYLRPVVPVVEVRDATTE